MANLLVKDTNITYTPGSLAVPYDPGQAYAPAHTSLESRYVCGPVPLEGSTMTWEYFESGDSLVPQEPTFFYSGSLSYVYTCRYENVYVSYPEQLYVAPTYASAAVDGVIATDYALGWNAGARSITSLEGDGEMGFKVPTNVSGVVAGMNNADEDASYPGIEHAWYSSHGIARVMESGVVVFYHGAHDETDVLSIHRSSGVVRYYVGPTLVYTSATPSIGTVFLDTSMYSGGDSVFDPYIKNTGSGSSYTSFLPLESIASQLLYAQSQASMLAITSVSGMLSGARASLAALTGLSSDRNYGDSQGMMSALAGEANAGFLMPTYAISAGAFPYLMSSAHGLTGEIGSSTGAMPALIGISSGDNVVSITVAVATGDAYASFQVSPTADNLVVGFSPDQAADVPADVQHGFLFDNGTVSLIESGTVVSIIGAFDGTEVFVIERHGGEVIYKIDGVVVYTSTVLSLDPVYLVEVSTDDSAVPADSVINDTLNQYSMRGYGASAASMLSLEGYSHAYEGRLNGTLWPEATVMNQLTGSNEMYVVIDNTLDVISITAVQVLREGDVLSSATVGSTTEAQAVLNALMQTTVFAGFGVPTFDTEQNECSIWVVNTETEATTRYENFDFNSYAVLDGRYFGCKTDGLYLLEGDADGVTPIRASIDFGKDNFGSAQLKSCPYAYLGISSSGVMYLKLTVEGSEYIYKARDYNTEMQVQRVDLGKGVRANYLRFELYNGDGCDFELDSANFNVVELSRRI